MVDEGAVADLYTMLWELPQDVDSNIVIALFHLKVKELNILAYCYC